jgi:hypothetical protein
MVELTQRFGDLGGGVGGVDIAKWTEGSDEFDLPLP